MSPLPATMPMLAQSQSSPRTLANNESEVTTNTSEMTSSAPTTVQNQINSSSTPSLCPGSNINFNSIENTNNNNNNNNNNNMNMNNSENSNNIPIKSPDFNILNSATTSSTTKNLIKNDEISESSKNVKSDAQKSSIAINNSKSTDSSTIVIDDTAGTGTGNTIDTNTNTTNNTDSSNNNNNCKNEINDSATSSKTKNCSQDLDNNSNKHNKCDYSSKSSNKVEDNDNNSNCDDEMNSSNIEEKNNTEEVLDKPRRILLKNVNPHIICNLCKGYLIDATTIVECLHSFCHSCIMKHLRTEQYCPRCEMMINTAKPNIKPDTTLQAIVYKLVPGLYEKELMRKRAFYRDRPEEAKLATPEQRGEDTEYLIFGPTENMSLSLEYADIEELPEGDDWNDLKRPKYLQCPAIFTVSHLKKFILLKFGINSNLFTVEIMYKVKTIVLSNHYTLMDVAYIYTWKRDAPMRFFFRIKKVDGFDEKLKACRRLIKIKEINNENKSNKILTKEENNNKDTRNSDSTDKNDKLIIKNENDTTEIEKKEKETSIKTSSDNTNNGVMRKNSLSRQSIELVADIKTENEIEEVNNSTDIKSIKIESDIKQEPIENINNSTTQINTNKIDTSSSSVAGSSINTKNTCKNQLTTNSKDDYNHENTIETSNKPEKLKMTFSMKNKQQPKINSSIDDSKTDLSTKSLHKNNKTLKQQQHQQQQQQQTSNTAIGNSQKSPDQEERKVENIKLKIDLSKQSSVTIINMSGPDNTRKEVVKPVKQEKEWKLKTKKDKDNSPKLSPKGEDKYTIKSNEDQQRNSSEDSKKLLVPPITIKAERISPNSKEKSTVQLKVKNDETKSQSDDFVTTNTNEKEDDEEKKSRFLNSFALTPIKSTNSPDKNNDKKPVPLEIPAIPSVPQWTGSVGSIPNKTVNVSKRKSKEPIKALTKKPKLESAKTKIDEPKMIKPIEKTPPKETQTISFKLAPFPIDSSSSSTGLTKKQEDEKLMPAPPPLKIIDVFKKNGMKQVKQSRSSKWTVGNKTKISSQSSQIPAPPGSLTPRPIIPTGIASSKLPITAATPGNRTPIARRYPPILPKSPRPNPFANLPTDVNKLLQHNGTEIKQIPSGNSQELKVYGPAMPVKNNNQKSTSPTSMPPPPPNMSPVRGVAKNQTTNYLNYALMNASKTKVDVLPLGCRTPIYTPNSPIYSPNSPQYMPNYNIPTQPTYKYTKTQSSANNYLQNVLGQNKQLSSLFPGPPVKKPPEQSIGNSKTPPPTQMSITSNDENTAKRSYPFSKSPPNATEKCLEPPEKQIKVQSLLNSCNINIPSSLSITITNEDNESGSVSGSNLKHKSPVNNYIEILKLPDNQPISSNDQTPLDPKLKTTNSFELKNEVSALSTNSLTSLPTTSSTKTITTNNTPRSSPVQITGTQSTKNTSNVNLTRSSTTTNTYEKKGDTVKTPSPNSKEKKTSPEKKTVEKSQKKNQALQDKKKSPDNTVKQGKTNETANNIVSLKKFRHILPRVTTTSQSISTTTLSVSTPSKSSPVQRNSLKQQSQQKISPSAAKKHNSVNAVDDKKPEILDLTGSSSKTPPPTMPSPLQPPPPSIPPVTTVTASINPPQMPPGASDIAAFLNETILRAQQHSAASGNGIFLPHLAAAASFNPSFASINFGYNIQQAYLMEQFSRMQKAGHEALEKYMQKLKANNGGNGNGGGVKSGPNSPNDSLNNVTIPVTNTSANSSGSSGANTLPTSSSPQMKTSETK